MTRLAQVANDERYTPLLDHGFVALLDHMGSDQSIEFATRQSYGEGTRAISDTRNLLRYLVRHMHTSPIEMGEVQFHLKLTIAMARQFLRHRTANVNEYSARYSILTDEFYMPASDRLALQSTDNKQGSGEEAAPEVQARMIEVMDQSFGNSFENYNELLGLGMSRETARNVMPVGGYTEMVWKCDLKNFLHFIRLRLDPHAQAEIRQMAQIMYDKVKPLFPLLCEAFEDYTLNGANLSIFEIEVLQNIVKGLAAGLNIDPADLLRREFEGYKQHHHRGDRISKREIAEFVNKFTAKDPQ